MREIEITRRARLKRYYIVVKPWLPGKRESLIVDMCVRVYEHDKCVHTLSDTRTMVTVSGCVVLEAAVGVTHCRSHLSTPPWSGGVVFLCGVTSWGNRGFGPHPQPDTKRGCDMTKN
eukprot:sb/3476577/